MNRYTYKRIGENWTVEIDAENIIKADEQFEDQFNGKPKDSRTIVSVQFDIDYESP